MNEVVISPPNAILFVLDPTNQDLLIPPYVDGELIASTTTCVSFGTQADVDGETKISLLAESLAPTNLQQVFLGNIVTPGGKVAIVTSHFQRVLEVEVSSDVVEISIWADDLRNPANVSVGVKPKPTVDG